MYGWKRGAAIVIMIKKLFARRTLGAFGQVLIAYASSQVISNVMRMVAGLLCVRLVDPHEFGAFSGIGVFLGYVLLGHGGVINGLSRQLPFELGRGNDGYAGDLASSTYALTSVLGGLAALSFLVCAIWNFFYGDAGMGFLFLSYVVIGGVHLFNKQFLPVLYRTNGDFQSLARQNTLLGVGNLVSVLLVWKWGLWGLCIRGILLALFECCLLYYSSPYRLRWRFRWEDYQKLIRVGFPIFVVGNVNPFWSTVINNLVFSIGGAANFGFYSLSNIVQGAIGVIPSSFSQVIYPRMAIMFGEGKSLPAIVKANVGAIVFQFIVIFLFATIGALVMPYVVPMVLPKYISGISAAQWMLFVPVVQSLGAFSNLYNVVGRQRAYLIALLVGGLIGTAFVFFALETRGFRLEIFPQGLLLGKSVQQVLSLWFLRKLVFNRGIVVG